MKNIVLIGMMGSGKTTCGLLLSEKLGRTLVDADVTLQTRENRTTSEIFATDGEGYYRDLETALCHELETMDDLVIATGGGMILREENVKALRSNGVVFLLNRPVDEIFDGEDLADRPLAQNGKQDFIDRFEARKPYYFGAADEVITNFASPKDTVNEILERMKKYQ
ncbi:MAG: shikimate kinase [Clostridiales bacterium]|nr:shikimate kinase [Clostridiales bacterium]